jgi:hypothetical protein
MEGWMDGEMNDGTEGWKGRPPKDIIEVDIYIVCVCEIFLYS